MRQSLPSDKSNRKLCEYIISYQLQADLEDSDNVCPGVSTWSTIEGLTSAQHATERLEDAFENIVTTATQNTLDEVQVIVMKTVMFLYSIQGLDHL